MATRLPSKNNVYIRYIYSLVFYDTNMFILHALLFLSKTSVLYKSYLI